MTFGAHKLVHSEPFLDYLYEVWQLLSALYNVMRKKSSYRCTSTFSALNYCSGIFFKSQLSIRCGAHKLFRRFLGFSNFLTPISQKLWRHLATKMRTMWCIWKNNPFWKKLWKAHQNWPINRHTILVWTMFPTHRQIKGDIKTPIFAPTAGARSSISPKLCKLIENVVTILKGVNHFSIQSTVFPAGAKMLISGHWSLESGYLTMLYSWLTHWVNLIPAGCHDNLPVNIWRTLLSTFVTDLV